MLLDVVNRFFFFFNILRNEFAGAAGVYTSGFFNLFNMFQKNATARNSSHKLFDFCGHG